MSNNKTNNKSVNMKRYDTLKPNDRLDAVSVRADFPTWKEGGVIVVRNEIKQKFMVFSNANQLKTYIEHIPADKRCLYEVFAKKRKPVFDVDCTVKQLADSAEATGASLGEIANNTLETIVNTLKEQISVIFKVKLHENDVCVCPSTPVEEENGTIKYSWHIILPNYYFVNNRDAKMFHERMQEKLPPKVAPMLDGKVYNKVQNMRLAGCHKKGSDRVKQLPAGFSFEQTLVGQVPEHSQKLEYDLAILLELVGAEAAAVKKQKSLPAQTNVSWNGAEPALLAGQVFALLPADEQQAHVFRKQVGSLLLFDRTMPTVCAPCSTAEQKEHLHEKDNTLMALVDEQWRVWLMCRRQIGAARVIGSVGGANRDGKPNEAAKNGKNKQTTTQKMESAIAAVLDERVTMPTKQGDIELAYNQPLFPDFPEEFRTLCVRSEMGTGKSEALARWLTKQPTAATMRFVSFRQTFTAETVTKLNAAGIGVVSYRDVKQHAIGHEYPRAVFQVESLRRNTLITSDIVVVDEIESVLEQFFSSTVRYLTPSWEMFVALLKYAKHVVLLDANLKPETVEIVRSIRDGTYTFMINEYHSAQQDRFQVATDEGKWMHRVMSLLEESPEHRVVVPVNVSAEKAQAIGQMIQERWSERKVMVYTKMTSHEEKEAHFANPNDTWSDADVLIYTPTVVAGISFTLERFTHCCALFTNTTTTVESARQMLRRVRNIATHQYLVCFNNTAGKQPKLPENVDDIERHLAQDRKMLEEEVVNLPLSFEFLPTGEVQYRHKSDPFFRVWLEHMRSKNRSRNRFAEIFIKQVRETGATVELMAVPSAKKKTSGGAATEKKNGQEARIKLQRTVEKVKEEQVQEIAKAVLPNDGDMAGFLQSIEERMEQQKDIPAAEMAAYRKHCIGCFYGVDARLNVTESFLLKYEKKEVREWYQNLNLVRSQPLEERRKQEQGSANTSDAPTDLTSDYYVHNKHAIATTIVRALWFDSIFDKNTLEKVKVEESMGVLTKMMKNKEQSSMVCRTFDRDAPTTTDFNAILRFANSILHKMYGVDVKALDRTRAGRKQYRIVHSAVDVLFTTPEPKGEEKKEGDAVVVGISDDLIKPCLCECYQAII